MYFHNHSLVVDFVYYIQKNNFFLLLFINFYVLGGCGFWGKWRFILYKPQSWANCNSPLPCQF
ncbi:hypothetical protein [Moraxella lacunata]|uniref:hypothetical protein n=1 Tax=Moraxella lacunata TaxID=477 RepID=UPI003EE14F83